MGICRDRRDGWLVVDLGRYKLERVMSKGEQREEWKKGQEQMLNACAAASATTETL